jgi:hypothetical protein
VSGEVCNRFVSWWVGEYEGSCEPDGHDGPHYDGMSWFNDDNEEVDAPGEEGDRNG